MKNQAIFVPAGILFFLGVVGFLPNPVVSSSGYFRVDAFHNLLHLFSGLALLFFGLRNRNSADLILKICGAFFILLSVSGFLYTKGDKLFGLLTASNPNNWLHLFFGVGLLALAGKRHTAPDISNSNN
jgi:hypothetical protein